MSLTSSRLGAPPWDRSPGRAVIRAVSPIIKYPRARHVTARQCGEDPNGPARRPKTSYNRLVSRMNDTLIKVIPSVCPSTQDALPRPALISLFFLKDLGIALGDRLKLLRAIRELGAIPVLSPKPHLPCPAAPALSPPRTSRRQFQRAGYFLKCGLFLIAYQRA